MKDMIKSLSLCAVGSVLIGSAVAQTGGSNREEGDVHTHNGNQVFWSAHAHDCPDACGIGTFMQTRSGALPLPAPLRAFPTACGVYADTAAAQSPAWTTRPTT